MNEYDLLKSFLLRRKSFKTHNYTHVSSYNPSGKFEINRCDTEEFWKLYCDYIFHNDEKDSIKCGLMEISEEQLPVLIDFDIKQESSHGSKKEKLYTQRDIQEVIRAYHLALKELLPEISEEEYICIVLEKPPYEILNNHKKYIKNGFHLHFPKIYLSKHDHFSYLIPLIKEKISTISFSSPCINTECLDVNYCKNQPWLLYGGYKNDSTGTYKISNIYTFDFNQISIKELIQRCPIYDIYHKQIMINNNEKWWLPRILSINNAQSVYEIRLQIQKFIKIDNLCLERHKYIFNYDSNTNIDQLKCFVTMLSKSRAENYIEWMMVGWCLFNITTGSKDGLLLWIEFSKKCMDKFKESKCFYEWSKMHKENMSIATLKYWAKIDSPKEYAAFIQSTLRKSLSGTNYGVSKFIYEHYSDKFICASITKKIWYQFEGHKWIKKDGGNPVDLRMLMSTKIREKYQLLKIELEKQLEEMKEEQEEEEDNTISMIKNEIKYINDLCIKLETTPYKAILIKECSDLFYKSDFLELLDTNEYLIAFKNGVYDLKSHTFRKGKSEDYISMEMGVIYNTELSEDSEAIQNVILFFKKVFPNEDIRNYFLYSLADLFIGGNRDKLFHIWSGAGDNGKSVTQKMIELLFNKYSVKFPTSVVIGKRSQSGAATPELARNGNGVRVAFLQEPDHSDQLNMGMVKELTGNDSMYIRPLYEEGREIRPMFKLILVCNEPPKINDMGRAAWNRPRIIPFESTFISNGYPETLEEQMKLKIFPKDTNFMEKIPDMLEGIAWYLLHILSTGIKPIIPKEITIATEQYKHKNDVFTQFVGDILIKEDDSKIMLDELYSEFKTWYKNCIHQHNIPNKMSFIENMTHTSILGKLIDNRYWKGIKFKYQSV